MDSSRLLSWSTATITWSDSGTLPRRLPFVVQDEAASTASLDQHPELVDALLRAATHAEPHPARVIFAAESVGRLADQNHGIDVVLAAGDT